MARSTAVAATAAAPRAQAPESPAVALPSPTARESPHGLLQVIVESPLGGIGLGIDGQRLRLVAVRWPVPSAEGVPFAEVAARAPSAAFADLAQALAEAIDAYFRGEFEVARRGFDQAAGPTPEGPAFFRACWEACRAIPVGAVLTYAELAVRAGGDARHHARSAGQAMRSNPWPLIIPCHRVISSNRGLHGFGGQTDPAGEALGTKRRLLEHEGLWVDARGRVTHEVSTRLFT